MEKLLVFQHSPKTAVEKLYSQDKFILFDQNRINTRINYLKETNPSIVLEMHLKDDFALSASMVLADHPFVKNLPEKELRLILGTSAIHEIARIRIHNFALDLGRRGVVKTSIVEREKTTQQKIEKLESFITMLSEKATNNPTISKK